MNSTVKLLNFHSILHSFFHFDMQPCCNLSHFHQKSLLLFVQIVLILNVKQCISSFLGPNKTANICENLSGVCFLASCAYSTSIELSLKIYNCKFKAWIVLGPLKFILNILIRPHNDPHTLWMSCGLLQRDLTLFGLIIYTHKIV